LISVGRKAYAGREAGYYGEQNGRKYPAVAATAAREVVRPEVGGAGVEEVKGEGSSHGRSSGFRFWLRLAS